MSEPTTKPYNPRDHLIKIRAKDGTLKDYYPAAWRLYELNLKFENHSFQSEILLLDVERNLVVVKCTLYFGGDMSMSPRKIEALKSGLLSQLDKVETAAKARCARDIGCGTEYALDLPDEEIAEVVSNGTAPTEESTASAQTNTKPTQEKTGKQLDTSVRSKLNDLYGRAKKLGLCTSDKQFVGYVRQVVDNPQLDIKYVTLASLSSVEDDLVTREMAEALESSVAS